MGLDSTVFCKQPSQRGAAPTGGRSCWTLLELPPRCEGCLNSFVAGARLPQGAGIYWSCALAAKVLGLQLQAFNLNFERFVFNHLALQKPAGQVCFFKQPGWGEQISVGQLALVALKVLHLEQTFGHQGLQAKVGYAKAKA